MEQLNCKQPHMKTFLVLMYKENKRQEPCEGPHTKINKTQNHEHGECPHTKMTHVNLT